MRLWKSDYVERLRRAIEDPFRQLVTPLRAKQPSARPRPPRRSVAPEETDQHASGTRLKRAAIHPDREAIDASIDAALRDLDILETGGPTKRKQTRRRVPPFPGTGISVAVPPLPSSRPKRK